MEGKSSAWRTSSSSIRTSRSFLGTKSLDVEHEKYERQQPTQRKQPKPAAGRWSARASPRHSLTPSHSTSSLDSSSLTRTASCRDTSFSSHTNSSSSLQFVEQKSNEKEENGGERGNFLGGGFKEKGEKRLSWERGREKEKERERERERERELEREEKEKDQEEEITKRVKRSKSSLIREKSQVLRGKSPTRSREGTLPRSIKSTTVSHVVKPQEDKPSMSGFLYKKKKKKGVGKKSWKSRYFSFSDQTIVYYSAHPCQNGEKKGEIYGETITNITKNVFISSRNYFGFQLHTPKKDYSLAAGSLAERELWVAAIVKIFPNIVVTDGEMVEEDEGDDNSIEAVDRSGEIAFMDGNDLLSKEKRVTLEKGENFVFGMKNIRTDLSSLHTDLSLSPPSLSSSLSLSTCSLPSPSTVPLDSSFSSSSHTSLHSSPTPPHASPSFSHRTPSPSCVRRNTFLTKRTASFSSSPTRTSSRTTTFTAKNNSPPTSPQLSTSGSSTSSFPTPNLPPPNPPSSSLPPPTTPTPSPSHSHHLLPAGVLILTNYRLLFLPSSPSVPTLSLPLLTIRKYSRSNAGEKKVQKTSGVEAGRKRLLDIICVDVRKTVRLVFRAGIGARRRFVGRLESVYPSAIGDCFAFAHFAAGASQLPPGENGWSLYDIRREYRRIGVENHPSWRISELNKDHSMCQHYPPFLVVPKELTDPELEAVASFRSKGRVPALSWIHPTTQAPLSRCSQPGVGVKGKRCTEDEQYLSLLGGLGGNHSKRLMVIDARAKVAAVANAARGGGLESSEFYHNMKINFMNIENIHAMRHSLFKFIDACLSEKDDDWWGAVSEWFSHIRGILSGAVRVVELLEASEPVLVHCSDGWDRTPQLTSVAQLLLDPYYRTITGFAVLVQKEWCDFGHKFAERCGTYSLEGDGEWSPIFLQFLECVYHLFCQSPHYFEFNDALLLYLFDEVYSGKCGTFLSNEPYERILHKVSETTISVWDHVLLNPHLYQNPRYDPERGKGRLHPKIGVKWMNVWRDLYFRHL